MIYLTTRVGHSQPDVLMMKKIKILSFLFLIFTAEHLFVNIRGYACSEAVSLLLCAWVLESKLFCAGHTETALHLCSRLYFHLHNYLGFNDQDFLVFHPLGTLSPWSEDPCLGQN